jgi:hypothetical protein
MKKLLLFLLVSLSAEAYSQNFKSGSDPLFWRQTSDEIISAFVESHHGNPPFSIEVKIKKTFLETVKISWKKTDAVIITISEKFIRKKGWSYSETAFILAHLVGHASLVNIPTEALEKSDREAWIKNILIGIPVTVTSIAFGNGGYVGLIWERTRDDNSEHFRWTEDSCRRADLVGYSLLADLDFKYGQEDFKNFWEKTHRKIPPKRRIGGFRHKPNFTHVHHSH